MKVSFRLYDCSARAERKKKTVVFVVVILDVVDVLWIIVQEMLSHSGITFSSISLSCWELFRLLLWMLLQCFEKMRSDLIFLFFSLAIDRALEIVFLMNEEEALTDDTVLGS